MTNHMELLEPLGGEWNLRIMCNVDKFIYNSERSVTFFIEEMKIVITCNYSLLFDSNFWSIYVYGGPYDPPKKVSTYITRPDVLLRTFEIFTGYSLSF